MIILEIEAWIECTRLHYRVLEVSHFVGDKFLENVHGHKYLVGLSNSQIRRQVMLSKPETINEGYVQALYIESDKKKTQPSGSK